MSTELTPVGAVTKDVIKYWKKIIGQAIAEGATQDAIDAYMESIGVQGREKYRKEVEAKPVLMMLGAGELKALGGRSAFRALFGLAPIAEVPIEIFDYPLTESGDSELFAEMYANDLRFDHLRGRWLIADDASGLWLPDRTSEVLQLALKTVRERQRRGVNLEDHANRKLMTDWALHGESRSRLSNLAALAEHRDPLSDPGDQWDTDPFLLGTHNGVVDLRTGQHRKATPEDRITMRVSTSFDAEATCPVWLDALAGIFAGHEVKHKVEAPESLLDAPSTEPSESQRVIDFIQRAMGYSITGDCREECCFFVWGDGRNGKGTLMNTIGRLLGDYTDDMPFATLEKSVFKSQSIPNDVAKIAGKRFITCSEINEFTLNEARLKALTGRDPITARFLNQEFFTFEPVGKIWIATNNKPKITGLDEGIWSRIHLVPFTNKFEGANRNEQLKDQLRQELPGILNWLIAGTQKWLAEGLNPPETVKVATEEYRRDSEPITPFLAQCCTLSGKVQAAVLFKHYVQWASAQQVENVLTDKQFHKCMKRRFLSESGRQTFYVGVALSSVQAEPSQEPGF